MDGWKNMKKNWLRFHKKHPSENLYLVVIPHQCKLNVTAKKTNYLRSLFCANFSNQCPQQDALPGPEIAITHPQNWPLPKPGIFVL
jgi:hypothetical protein